LTTEFGEKRSSWIYQTKVHNVDELKQRMLCLVRGLEQSVINDATNEGRERLGACIRAK